MVRTSRSKAPARRRGPEGQTHSVTTTLLGFSRMTRSQAITMASQLLRRSPTNSQALRLIHLFHIDADELAQAGVPYELLRALDRHPLMRF
jgi:hypothetical protein